jgi:hypothetical protein
MNRSQSELSRQISAYNRIIFKLLYFSKKSYFQNELLLLPTQTAINLMQSVPQEARLIHPQY